MAGDLFAAGYRVEVTGAVGGDATAMGYEVITGSVTGNLRATGSEITVGSVGGYALIIGADISLTSTIAGDAVLVADDITLRPRSHDCRGADGLCPRNPQASVSLKPSSRRRE